MTTTINKVLAKAASQIGGYFPGNSPYGLWYAKQHGDVYKDAQFCAIGLSWCFDQVNGLDIFPEHAYTPSGVQWFKNKGRWHTGSVNNIPRGAIIYFDFPGFPNRVSHVGIAEKHGSNGMVQTIEFNTSSTVNGDQRNGRTVARKVRGGASIVGWGMPDYDTSTPVVSPGHMGPGVGIPKPPKPSASKFNPKTDRLDVDGVWGGDVTTKMQYLLGTPVDGEISNQNSDWKNDNPGLTRGWDWTGKEGDGGSKLIRTHQTLLKRRGHYKGKIDGKVGPQYFKALQQDLNTHADGHVDHPSSMVRALQKRLNYNRL
jgi:hypothetical protein